MVRAGIALGSNLGDRVAHLRAALNGLRRIADPQRRILAAPLYETEPQACPDGSPPFLNTVVEIGWNLTPLGLLDETRRLEIRLGRMPNPTRNAPRVIDIDILYCGDAVIDHPDLVLPHPRLAVRRFVLEPLAAIRPDLRLPGFNQNIQEILENLSSSEAPPTRHHAAAWQSAVENHHSGE